MRSYVERRRYPGCSVLIARDGREVFYAEEGLRDLAAGRPFTRDTVVRIFSMTKPIVSVALMTLVEQGLFPLETPVSEFLPEFAHPRALVDEAERLDQAEPVHPPTLHQLLTHTSGLSYSFNPGPVPRAMAEQAIEFKPRQGPLADLVRRLAGLPLAFPPGRRWEYSVGIDVIGRVIEVVTGKPLDAALDEIVLGPLGMSETRFRLGEDQLARFACLYTPLADEPMALAGGVRGDDPLREIDRPETTPWRETTTFSGGGGLVGTIDDYMRFCEMLRRGGSFGGARILSPATLRFMMRNHLPGDIASMGPASFAEQPMDGMGFGIGGAVVLDPARARIPGSEGDFSWGGMASTFFWIDPRQKLSVVFFTQLSPSSSYPSRAELKALVHGALLD
ncbi:MAG: class A beta-lactamase-related serine hydrolase [Alphaproteobacteria bacterium]|nr:MAG: class A beta-lactamase-related serine hydrolase [Alphaproteobacteria bacterium]